VGPGLTETEDNVVAMLLHVTFDGAREAPHAPRAADRGRRRRTKRTLDGRVLVAARYDGHIITHSARCVASGSGNAPCRRLAVRM